MSVELIITLDDLNGDQTENVSKDIGKTLEIPCSLIQVAKFPLGEQVYGAKVGQKVAAHTILEYSGKATIRVNGIVKKTKKSPSTRTKLQTGKGGNKSSVKRATKITRSLKSSAKPTRNRKSSKTL